MIKVMEFMWLVFYHTGLYIFDLIVDDTLFSTKLISVIRFSLDNRAFYFCITHSAMYYIPLFIHFLDTIIM